jgi:hypothetical protein
VILSDFTAAEYEGKVLLQWRTGYEANNLGFHVYREEEDGQLTRINPGLITGGAFLAGANLATAGHSYAWWDTLDPTATLNDRPKGLEARPFGPRGQRAENFVASSEVILERSDPLSTGSKTLICAASAR